MEEHEFKEIPTFLEEMKATWGKINSPNLESVKLDKSDLHAIREAFVAATKYEELNKLWLQAYSLFLDKHKWTSAERQKKTREAHKEAAEKMGFITEDQGKKYHPQREREIYEDYIWYQLFCFQDKDGNFVDEEGNVMKERELKIKVISNIEENYGFPSFKSVTEHLRKKYGLENLPDIRDHSK